MSHILIHARIAAATLVSLLAWTTFSFAAEVNAEAMPEDATVYADALPGLSVPSSGYRSKCLRGNFLGGPMYIVLDGKKVSFWGARIFSLADDSPLRKLGMRPGDVLTRLDGVTLDTEKFEKERVWQLPELERHYGPTEVRWIKVGSHRVNVDQLDLGDAPADVATASLHGVFAIRLLPGFKDVPLQGIDSLPGKLVHSDGRDIRYEVGLYYPPGAPRTGGAYENGAHKAAEERKSTVKELAIGDLNFSVLATANSLIVSTASVPHRRGINFACVAKTPEEVADALLMILSLQALPAAPSAGADVPPTPPPAATPKSPSTDRP